MMNHEKISREINYHNGYLDALKWVLQMTPLKKTVSITEINQQIAKEMNE